MPVYRDSRTGNWFYKTSVKFPDGTGKRIRGTPGVPGPWHTLPQSKSGAAEAERRAIAEAVTGKSAKEVAPTVNEKSISELADKFVETYKPGSKPGERREKARVLKRDLLPYFGAKTATTLRQEDIDEYAQREIDRGVSIKTVNNKLAILSTLIRYRLGHKLSLRFKLAGMLGEVRAVDPADVEKLLQACTDPRYRAVILLAYEAGLRAGEIRGLQHGDVRDGVLTVRRGLDKLTNEAIAPKHNKARTIPLSPRLAEAISVLPKVGVWVVTEADGRSISYDDLIATVNAIYAAAGVTRPKKPLHCIRHSFGTVTSRRVPLAVVQQLMGHADVKTTLRYIDVAEADKRDAIAAVFGSAAPEPSGAVRDVSADKTERADGGAKSS